MLWDFLLIGLVVCDYSRAAELQNLVSTKLLQKKSASYGNNVRQDGVFSL